jgi:apolipoprotein N-acyltransferase
VLALAAGVLHAVSFAPGNLPWLELACLALVLGLALAAPTRRAAAWLGLAFGLGWFGAGVSWVYISLHGHGELAAPLAALSTAGLAALLAAFPAGALAAGCAAGAPGSGRRALALGAAWTLSDWLRGVVLTGFPWIATGYAHTDGPLAGYAPVAGVYGVGAAACACVLLPLWAAGAARRAQRGTAGARGYARAGFALAASLALLLLGEQLREREWSEDAGRPVRVRLVQGNIPQDLKFGEGGMDLAAARYLPTLPARPDSAGPPAQGANGTAPDLIVFPESAFPAPINELPDYVLQAVGDSQLRSGAALIFGIFIVEPGWRYYNSAIGLGDSGSEPQRYSKRHLVPFGEFIPFGMHWFVRMLQIPIGDQEAGEALQAPMRLAGEEIAVNICFEDLFGGEIRAAWNDPAHAPTMMLNLSNLAWFDDSIALAQHLQISRMRALETARPLAQATNTGVTAIIDSRGRVQAQLPIQAVGVLEGAMQGKRGNTPFLLLGNAPVVLLAALAWLACRFARVDPGRPGM